jgi:hypothetical protein
MAAAEGEGVTNVAMRCRSCGHDWKFAMPANTEIARMRSGVRLPIAHRDAD